MRHGDTKSDYEFNRFLDGVPCKQANQELTFEILSPVGSDYELMSDAKCIGRSAEGAGRAICRLANDARVDVEDYLGKLKGELMSAIQVGQMVRLQ